MDADQADEWRELAARGMSQQAIADAYGVKRGQVQYAIGERVSPQEERRGESSRWFSLRDERELELLGDGRPLCAFCLGERSLDHDRACPAGRGRAGT